MSHAISDPLSGSRQPAVDSLYTRFCAKTSRICMWIAIGGVMALMAAVSWQVIGRYVFNNTPTWAESLALVIVIYVTMLGTAVGVRDAGHIGLESFLVLAPDALRIKLEYLIHALVAFFGAVMAWNCAILGMSVVDYNIPTLGISEGLRYLPACACGVLILLFSIEHIIALARGIEVEPSWR
jgi:TRAP-type C4-dicarboxylate transport system permease small subunit